MKDILLVMFFIIALGMIVAIVGFIVGADDVYGLKYIAPIGRNVTVEMWTDSYTICTLDRSSPSQIECWSVDKQKNLRDYLEALSTSGMEIKTK